jgi:hypothetical protein
LTYGCHKLAHDRHGGLGRKDEESRMKLIIGKPGDSEIVLAEQVGGVWRPNPNLAAEMVTFLQGADPEQFEMWVEEPE